MTAAVITLSVLLLLAIGVAIHLALCAMHWSDRAEAHKREGDQLRRQRDELRRQLQAFEQIDGITAATRQAIRRTR